MRQLLFSMTQAERGTLEAWRGFATITALSVGFGQELEHRRVKKSYIFVSPLLPHLLPCSPLLLSGSPHLLSAPPLAPLPPTLLSAPPTCSLLPHFLSAPPTCSPAPRMQNSVRMTDASAQLQGREAGNTPAGRTACSERGDRPPKTFVLRTPLPESQGE